MAKVGSNAVVVRPVPAGATAVGNPARIIQKDESKIKTDAASVLFSSYGITPNEDDPLIKALRGLINNAAAQEHQLKTLFRHWKRQKFRWKPCRKMKQSVRSN